MENATHSHSSMPLVSRLDHLDFILNYLEGRQSLPKCSIRGTERQSVPLDLAVREAYFKGSLVERVAFLERRLFQLCLEVESSSTSQTSSSQGSKSEPSFSLPISSNPNQGNKEESLLHANYRPHVKETSANEEQRSKIPKPTKQKIGEGKTCKRGKKEAPPKWPRFKMLGC
ncbi:hypothetical protein P3X46_026017 [Hevea brasiliensis]|uniref:NPH3 domain-containing protein n=1 Tax=Hevea brasiliensis TaxID=3981 RepID=A0ABQ9KY70_HEVBR|nr:uncharacterized protein LOC110657125 [Hevea brasiliensis]KAJ9152452.1 hypothetical protein P3X46_026017 [Hevea brasiliensis]